MATLREIKRRIKAVHSTKQITSAMKMVAASKLRRAQDNMMRLRPYSDKMDAVIKSLAALASPDSHPLLALRPKRVVEVLVFTSDRGLCGAYNANVMKAYERFAAQHRAESSDVKLTISTVGKKARDYFKRREIPTVSQWVEFSGRAGFSDAQEVASALAGRYVSGETDEVVLIYNTFKNAAQQIVVTKRLLPLVDDSSASDASAQGNFIYEPSEDALLEALLPRNVEVQVYRASLEALASEEAARMAAMENATKSCSEMIQTLTLKYNKARQATITGELMDIVGGVEALKG